MQILPLVPRDFGLTQHRVTSFDCIVNGAFKKEDLENPTLMANVAQMLTIGSEVRFLADDTSFVATGICTYAKGSTAKIKVISFTELDEVKDMKETDSDFEAKLKGPKKWCVIKKSTGEELIELIPTQAEALKWIKDQEKALAA